MTKAGMLNRPLRCVQELSEFDVAMGWAFRDLTLHDEHQSHSPDQDDLEREHRELKRREHTHTAFDERVEIPREFVGPTGAVRTKQASHSHKKTKKTAASMVHSAVYSKRPTSKNAPAKPKPLPASKDRSRSCSRSPTRQEEVDFVYDVDTRRKLRERMDAERIETLHRAEEKEAKLRGEHKWVSDRPPLRKQAWHSSSDSQDARPASPTEKPRRVTSAGSSGSRSLSGGTGTATKALSSKTSIAANLSEWRTQEFPVYASAETQYVQRQREDAQRQAQQRRDAREVVNTIDAFEQNLKQWTS